MQDLYMYVFLSQKRILQETTHTLRSGQKSTSIYSVILSSVKMPNNIQQGIIALITLIPQPLSSYPLSLPCCYLLPSFLLYFFPMSCTSHFCAYDSNPLKN